MRVFNTESYINLDMKIVINAKYHDLAEFINSLPAIFDKQGEVLNDARNVIKRFQVGDLKIVVKKYKLPNLFQRIIYSTIRPTKAQRAYDYGLLFKQLGVETPEPIAYILTYRTLFRYGYFLSLNTDDESVLQLLQKSGTSDKERFENNRKLLTELAIFLADLHQKGIFHGDLNLSNVLYRVQDNKYHFSLIDTNRTHFHKNPSNDICIDNLTRLTQPDLIYEYIVKNYAKTRNLDEQKTIKQASENLSNFRKKRNKKARIKRCLKI